MTCSGSTISRCSSTVRPSVDWSHAIIRSRPDTERTKGFLCYLVRICSLDADAFATARIPKERLETQDSIVKLGVGAEWKVTASFEPGEKIAFGSHTTRVFTMFEGLHLIHDKRIGCPGLKSQSPLPGSRQKAIRRKHDFLQIREVEVQPPQSCTSENHRSQALAVPDPALPFAQLSDSRRDTSSEVSGNEI